MSLNYSIIINNNNVGKMNSEMMARMNESTTRFFCRWSRHFTLEQYWILRILCTVNTFLIKKIGAKMRDLQIHEKRIEEVQRRLIDDTCSSTDSTLGKEDY